MEAYAILSDEQYRELKRIKNFSSEMLSISEKEMASPDFFGANGRWSYLLGQLIGTVRVAHMSLNLLLDTAAIVYGEDPTYEMSECANGPHFWNQNELHLIDDSHCPDCQEVAPARVNPDPEDVEAET